MIISPEIIDTEVSEVPEVLDYRNWFRYEMKVMSPNNDGKIIDRRTKSIGSGGEQAVPNYLLVMTIAHFLYEGSGVHLRTLLFDEAFYGIDAGRRDQAYGGLPPIWICNFLLPLRTKTALSAKLSTPHRC